MNFMLFFKYLTEKPTHAVFEISCHFKSSKEI